MGLFLPPGKSRRILHILGVLFVFGAVVALYPEPFVQLAARVGLGRAVDGVLYVAVVILVREFFLSRVRHRALEREFALLVRRLALQNAQADESRSGGLDKRQD